MAILKIKILNILYGAAIVFAIGALQKTRVALLFNFPSKIQEERTKSLPTSFKPTIFLALLVSMVKQEVLTILCDFII
jgi:hypothetical protein